MLRPDHDDRVGGRKMRNRFYNAFDAERGEEYRSAPADDYRTPFQVDRDRIIHSSAFRRLQNKTQVFFSGEYDFYRTRLTHSIEVAQIGRSLCHRLNQVSPLLERDRVIDADLVEAACLAHDIGHPPFGHTGERTLHRLMRPWGGFEGNAQTLRILTTILFGPGRGMNPTRGLVDGVLKYKTLFGEVPEQSNHFLYAEQGDSLDFVTGGRTFPDEISPGSSRNRFRSLECQLMDWADDTAYSLNDIADGIHAGFITTGSLERWAAENEMAADEQLLFGELVEAIARGRIESTIGKKIGRFIGATSIRERESFLSDLSARHRYELVIEPSASAECDFYKRIAFGLVFRTRQLQQLDRKSDFILTRLFEVFAEQYIVDEGPPSGRFQLLSAEEENQLAACESETERARVVCDYLAKMTDGIATRTYKRLFDPDFGSINDLV